jgi:hypothetical protein
VRVLALPLLLTVASASWGQAETPKPPETPTPAPSPAPAVTPAVPPLPAPPIIPPAPPPIVRIPDKGDFKVVYEKPKNPEYRELQQIFKETQLLEETVKALNETIALPADVTVSLRECGASDAPYEPDKRRISICYELIDTLSDLFTADASSEEDLQQAGIAVAGATLFIFFHQAGHALIRLDGLTIPGGEEEEADQLATLVLLDSGREGEKAAMDGASTFLNLEKDPKAQALLAKMPFWSAHALDPQRFATIICWIYGKNPTDFLDLVEDGTLSEERAAQCPAEYERMAKAWETPLAPYLKGGPPSPPPPTP